MTLRTIFVVDGIVATAFGLGLIAAPALVLGLYGTHLDTAGVFLGRLFGAFVLGIGLILWLNRDAAASAAGIAITRALAALDWISAVICTAGIVQGLMNGMGWSLVALFVAFGTARVYFGFVATPKGAAAMTP